jgi:hypothetical protein
VADEHTHKISGPGAADVLTAPGGIDAPEGNQAKGSGILREETHFTDPRHLELEADDAGADERMQAPEAITGSQTGTIGGGGADAHNPDPVRATGQDDPSVDGGND